MTSSVSKIPICAGKREIGCTGLCLDLGQNLIIIWLWIRSGDLACRLKPHPLLPSQQISHTCLSTASIQVYLRRVRDIEFYHDVRRFEVPEEAYWWCKNLGSRVWLKRAVRTARMSSKWGYSWWGVGKLAYAERFRILGIHFRSAPRWSVYRRNSEINPTAPPIARNWSYSDLFVCWRSWRSCNRFYSKCLNGGVKIYL